MADRCAACGLPRAQPGEAKRNLRLVLLAVGLAPHGEETAALDALEPLGLGRCWLGSDATCAAWHEREAEECARAREGRAT